MNIEHPACDHQAGLCVWTALRAVVGHEGCDAFMFMGVWKAVDRQSDIWLYKHRDTRRYLNIDLRGDCWTYDGAAETYQLIGREDALARARS